MRRMYLSLLCAPATTVRVVQTTTTTKKNCKLRAKSIMLIQFKRKKKISVSPFFCDGLLKNQILSYWTLARLGVKMRFGFLFWLPSTQPVRRRTIQVIHPETQFKRTFFIEFITIMSELFTKWIYIFIWMCNKWPLPRIERITEREGGGTCLHKKNSF